MKNKFTVMESEENTVLEVIEELGFLHNNLVDDVENKTDLYGDHKGSWQGLSKPTLSDEGMRATVEKINEVDLPTINEQITDINTFKEINMNSQPINILFLGGKNDGSEDIGIIINQYTEKFALYLPPGIYKVSTPIVLKNSLFGGGFSRHRVVNNNFTWLVSDISEGSLITIPTNVKIDAMSIQDLSIQLNGVEDGIHYNSERLLMTSIKNVSIIDVSKKGIHVNPKAGVTRSVTGENLVIIGKAYQSSCGIYISDKGYDCRFTNVEIMGTKEGIITYEIVYGSTLHIWTGSMSGQDNGTWWQGTVGIRAIGKAIARFTNIYLDSCFILFVCENDGRIIVDNLLYWEDKSMIGCTRYDGSLTWTKDCSCKDNVIINSGTINLGERLTHINSSNTFKTNVKYITDRTMNDSNWKGFPFFDEVIEYDDKANSEALTYYKHVATVVMKTHGICEFNISMEGGQSVDILVNKKFDSETPIITGKLVGAKHEIYYKKEGDFIKFYIKVASSHSYQIKLKKYYGLRLLNVGALLKNDRSKYTLTEKLTDESGLSLITVS